MTDIAPGRPIALATLPNLRDLGGWQTADGRRVRAGAVYRSTDLHRLAGVDRDAFDQLGIATIYDLRTAAEREVAPDPGFAGVDEVPLDVLADASMAVPANLGAMLADPESVATANTELAGGRAVELVSGTYRELVTLPSARTSYRSLFLGLLDAGGGPSLFHCTTGKDRTGWAAAAFLSVLGVPTEDVFTEYLLTNEQLIPALEPVFAQFEAAGGDPALLRPVLGVERIYLEGAFDEMREQYGDIEGYFETGLGIDERGRSALRDRYLVGSADA